MGAYASSGIGYDLSFEMNEFQDTYFVTSLLSLLRIFILNKDKELEMKITLKILLEIVSSKAC